jgi:hypothetical protein
MSVMSRQFEPTPVEVQFPAPWRSVIIFVKPPSTWPRRRARALGTDGLVERRAGS